MSRLGSQNPARIWATCINTLAFLVLAFLAFVSGHPGVAWTCLVVAIILAAFTVA